MNASDFFLFLFGSKGKNALFSEDTVEFFACVSLRGIEPMWAQQPRLHIYNIYLHLTAKN